VIRLALRGMCERRARTAFTTIAVTLGVALVAGTLILSDTIEASFDRLLASSGANVDVNVVAQGQNTFGTPVTLPAEVAQRAGEVEGAAAAAGSLGDVTVAVVDERGERVGPTTGAPTLAYSTVPERFDPYGYEEGRAPVAEGEIAIGLSAAQDAGLAVGDRVQVLGNGPARPFRVVGMATFGGTGALGGAGFVVLTLPEVQALATEPGRITEVDLEAVEGMSPEALAGRVRAALGEGVVVRTGEEADTATARDFGEILGYLTTGLLVFGAIALLVGAFVIFNTFTITIAQRTRELGMLRTLGASRRQVLRAVLFEALLIGAAGAVLGLLGGLVLAPGLRAMMASFGFELPDTALVVAPVTVVVALVVGTVVTLLACLVPALRATRVPPLAALREADLAGGAGALSRRRLWTQGGVAGLGLVLMAVGLVGGLGTTGALALLGAGALAVFVGAGMLSPLAVGPVAAVVGRPLQAVGGVAGSIARANATRFPGRTAGTAAALMVGVALVAFASIFVNGFKASFSGAFEEAVTADLVVFDTSGLMPETVAGAAAGLPGVDAAANLRVGQGELAGDDVSLAGLDPAIATKVVSVDWDDGSDDALRALGRDGAMVEAGFAAERGLQVGAPLELRNRSGDPVALTVRGTYEDRGQLLGDVTVAERTLREQFGARQVLAALVAVAPGAEEAEVRGGLAGLLDERFPTLEPQSREEFIDSQVGQINQILYLFYALLALSVLIALFGIVNALALSVHERTRELGLLRAVGTSRRQVRRIVRGEAVITAVMGAALGVAIGVLFGVLISRPLEDEGFVLALPLVTLVVLLVLGALAGVLAAIAPARRASRVDVLRALTYE